MQSIRPCRSQCCGAWCSNYRLNHRSRPKRPSRRRLGRQPRERRRSHTRAGKLRASWASQALSGGDSSLCPGLGPPLHQSRNCPRRSTPRSIRTHTMLQRRRRTVGAWPASSTGRACGFDASCGGTAGRHTSMSPTWFAFAVASAAFRARPTRARRLDSAQPRPSAVLQRAIRTGDLAVALRAAAECERVDIEVGVQVDSVRRAGRDPAASESRRCSPNP
jgi:hypothetical protein